MSERGRVREVLTQVALLASEYYELTGKPLGVTGEVGEVLAAQLLDLDLCPPRTSGYDATSRDGLRRFQIKTRMVRPGSRGGRVSQIKTQSVFDAVLLVLLSPGYQVIEIYEAPRDAVIKKLSEPGSKARNERGALDISQFRAVASRVWPPA